MNLLVPKKRVFRIPVNYVTCRQESIITLIDGTYRVELCGWGGEKVPRFSMYVLSYISIIVYDFVLHVSVQGRKLYV